MRLAATTILIFLLFAGTACAGVSVDPQRLNADTLYHAVLDLESQTISVRYGVYVLVSCRFDLSDDTDAKRLADADSLSPVRTVTTRRVWSATDAVPERTVKVVSATTSAAPEQVARIRPDRFQIGFNDGTTLQMITVRGQEQSPGFAEKWRQWLTAFCPESAPVRMIVSADDAQTLYYALEPGTLILVVPAGM